MSEATVYESDRNLSLLVRKYVYRTLLAFIGHPIEGDTYHDSSGSAFGLNERACKPLENVPDGMRASGCVFPDNINYVQNRESALTGGERAFDVTFDILIMPASKIKDSERVNFIERVSGFLNTYIQEWPKFEGIFGMIELMNFEPEFEKYGSACGRQTWGGLMRRKYTFHTEVS